MITLYGAQKWIQARAESLKLCSNFELQHSNYNNKVVRLVYHVLLFAFSLSVIQS